MITGGETSDHACSVNNINNPFYIYSRENPRQIVATHLLTGLNYNSWSHTMQVTMNAKNKLIFVDGTIVKPLEHDFAFDAWR